MPLSLSILDLVPLSVGVSSHDALDHSLTLVRQAEALGYERLWYAEHHNMPGIASTTPSLMIARAGMVTQRIRLGAGGVMLPNHSPLQVAETYRMLEAMLPGRVDLGLGRAPGTDPTTALALRRSRQAMVADDFPEQFRELNAYALGGFPANHPFRQVSAQPDDVPLPPLWLLGSSDYSAHMAARLGYGFAYAAHFSPTAPEGPMLAYREEFTPGPLARPHSILALSVFCADTVADAERLAAPMRVAIARLRTGRPARLLGNDEALAYPFSPLEDAAASAMHSLQIIGTPATCRARIEELAGRTQADEVMITTHASDQAARLRSFELLARAFALRAAA